jgi:hypothetical protein
MARTYAQLSLEDRCEFARLLANGGLVRRIAAALDRSPSGPTAPSDAFVGSVSTAPTARWLRLALHPCVPRFQRCLHPQDGHSSGNSMLGKESQKLRFPYPSQLARTLPSQGNGSKYLALQSSIFADRSQIGLRAALAGIKGRGRPYFAPTTRARLRTEPQPAINQLRRSYGKRRISGYRLVRLSIFEFLPLRNGWAGPSKPPQDSGTRLAGMTTQVRRISLFCLANVPTPAKADPAKGSIR